MFTRPALAVVLTPYGIERTLITVTTSSDASNGVVATVQGLLADPGSDGISLREAIEATNNDPGEYTIRFAAGLKGATIRVGSSTSPFELPPLTGGGVLIDGDIDGDSDPDVTILSDGPRILNAFMISSSGNQLKALTLQGFGVGVDLRAGVAGDRPPSFQTYAGNVVSGLVMKKIRITGIWFAPNYYPECLELACETHNSWVDTQFVGNTIEAGDGGIDIQLNHSVGDRVERLTIAGNTIRVINEIPAVNRVALDLSSKRPATIEWE